MTGVVLSGTGGVWRVLDGEGVVREASLRGRLKKGDALKLAVGDEVRLEEDERGGAWAIVEIAPRRSQLARRAPGGGAPGRRRPRRACSTYERGTGNQSWTASASSSTLPGSRSKRTDSGRNIDRRRQSSAYWSRAGPVTDGGAR